MQSLPQSDSRPALWALPRLPLDGDLPDIRRLPELQEPGDKTYFVLKTGQELSHLVFYYDIGRSIDSARQADILLVGNSRTQLGLDERFFAAEAESLGIKSIQSRLWTW